MSTKGIRSIYSQSPFQIIMCDNQGEISTGTAFFYSIEGSNYLISNWHNFSGKHFITKEKLGKRLPTYIKAKFATKLKEINFTTISHRIEIYKDLNPTWYEHPTLESNCDVVAIEMEKPNFLFKNMHDPANLINSTKIPIKPGNTSFVIGYPKSISVAFGLPLWKSGFIASEPNYDVTIGGKLSDIGGLKNGISLPAFFIDTQTREGMSGSPVFASYSGNWYASDPYKAFDPDNWMNEDYLIGANEMEFIGCYSGRIGKKEEGAALGLCWREDVIKSICKTKHIGKHPHVN